MIDRCKARDISGEKLLFKKKSASGEKIVYGGQALARLLFKPLIAPEKTGISTGEASGTSEHMNGRVYDPALGRFLSPDPFVQDPDNSQSFNRYSYTQNNPLSYTDPSGFTCGKPGPVAPGGISVPCNLGGGGGFGGAGFIFVPTIFTPSQDALSSLISAFNNSVFAQISNEVGIVNTAVIFTATGLFAQQEAGGETSETEKQDEAKAENKEKRTAALGVTASAPSPNGEDPNNGDKDKGEKERTKGDRMTSKDNSEKQFREIQKEQNKRRKQGDNTSIESIKKSKQRADNALKPHNIDLDNLDDFF